MNAEHARQLGELEGFRELMTPPEQCVLSMLQNQYATDGLSFSDERELALLQVTYHGRSTT